MAVLRVAPLGAIGAQGQNTQAPHVDLPPQFATVAQNCYLDLAGRLTARASFKRITADNASLTTSAGVHRVFRHNKADGTSVIIAAGNNKLFRSDGSTLTQIGTGYSGNRWQFATLNGKLFAAQTGHSLRWFNETTWAETTIATPFNPRAIASAFGRLWALSADGWTLSWSDLLDGTNFTAGASGSLDLLRLHTTLRSPGVAVAAFGRSIAVLCADAVLMLGLADDLNPNNTTQPIYLAEHLPNVGCVARDSVVSTGDDLLFLAPSGLRSLRRSLIDLRGPSPMQELSAANKDQLIANINASVSADITACWHPGRSWYQLFLPDVKELWNFDMAAKTADGLPVTTVWTLSDARLVRHGLYWTNDAMLYGTVGGLASNDEYDGSDSYSMTVSTGWMSVQSPEALKHFKRLLLNLYGGYGQTAVMRTYVDFNDASLSSETFVLNTSFVPAEYGTAEYGLGEYSVGESAADNYITLLKSAKFIKIALDIPVSARRVSLNNAQVYYAQGRIL